MDTIKIIIALLLIAGSAFADTLPTFAEMYMLDLFFARLHWQERDQNLFEVWL